MLVPKKYLVASLDLLISSMLYFVKTVKINPLSFSGMHWLLFLYTCKAFAARSEIFIYYMMVGGTNTNLVKSLKQRFTSNGKI